MSNLLKSARALRGDDWYVERLKQAVALASKSYTDHLATTVTMAIADLIDVDPNMTVSTARVTDEALIAAVEAYIAPTPTEPGPLVIP